MGSGPDTSGFSLLLVTVIVLNWSWRLRPYLSLGGSTSPTRWAEPPHGLQLLKGGAGVVMMYPRLSHAVPHA